MLPYDDDVFARTPPRNLVLALLSLGLSPPAAFAQWAAGCDLLVLECSLPQTMAIIEHLTPEQCGEIACLAAPRTLVLTHLYPPVELVDIKALVAARYEGPLVIAHDGWSTELGD